MPFTNPPVALSKLLGPRTTTALVALSIYIAACRGLRYLRREKKHAQYPYKTKEEFSKMTTEHAWEITRYVMTLEFPFMSEKALQFALFKTYGIPSISALLCQTRQLAEPEFAPRRYSDTTTLITEFLAHSPTSDRANSAIARMNYLHNMYQRSGKISNDDMLYTLSLFVLEVERWIRLYEWRRLTDMEICALGTLWKSIGDAMNIDFSSLAHSPNFASGFEFFHDLRVWAATYEERAMIPTATNHKLAEETTAILLYNVPWFLKKAGKNAVSAMMDERLRRAMIYPPPPPPVSTLTTLLLHTRRLFLTSLLPPRPTFLRYSTLSSHPDPQTGRYHTTAYEAEPWYFKSTFWTRNAPSSWLRWATGRPWPDGKKYASQGYLISEVGPVKYEKFGREECNAGKEKLMGAQRGGCPFAVVR